jgi:plasmid stabilization system protein ParE
MSYKAVFLPLEDKRNIKTYLGRFYPSTPKKFIAALKAKIAAVKEMHVMYPVYADNPAYWKITVSNYLMFYKINEAQKTVEIHRILPGSWDLARIMG